ncbi:MAG: ribonuclease R [Hyphomicrobiales bacterium]|nr:ribonuclease R [Hyphomicrobiales bacterium]
MNAEKKSVYPLTKKSDKRTGSKTRKKLRKNSSQIPTREQILDFVANNPTRNSKRDIAREFGVTGDARIELKALLKDLLDGGMLLRQGKKLSRSGSLPPVTTLDIVTRDRNGGLLAIPSKWNEKKDGRPPTVSIASQNNSGTTAGIGDCVLARVSINEGVSGPGTYVGKVMKVLDRQKSSVLGILREHGDNFRLEPANRKQKEVDITAESAAEGVDGDLVEVEVGRSGKYGLKNGKVIQVIGSFRSEQALSMIAIHENNIPHIFPQSVLDEADKLNSISPATMEKSREDWRSLPLITIDPGDAKDHDDAIFSEFDNSANNQGGFVVTVAIADVSWYVRPGSALDREALKRGNSVYFPDRVVPMLPERISNDLCSLKENVDRPALAVRMVFEANGRKRSHSFHRILMRSPAKLSYEQAQAAIDGQGNERTNEILESVLIPLWQAYACLKKGRDHREPLDIDVPERKIILKSDGTVDRIFVPDRLDAHKLVEEFMIQANVAAAESLEQAKQSLIYRIHDSPSLAKLESFREFLKTMDMSLTRSGNLRPVHFNAILNSVRNSDNNDLVNQVVLRSQSQAEYSPQNIGHFGLNLARYAHFTSPIRRYADLIVHRALIGSLKLGQGAITRDEEANLDVIAADISLTERRASQAERDTLDRLISTHLSQSIGHRFSGRINGVTRAGLFVTLADTGADGFIPIKTIADEYLIFDPASHSIVGEKTGLAYQMGQIVEVKLIEAAPVAGSLLFEMLSEGTKTGKLPRSRRTNAKQGKPSRNFGGRRKKRRH